MVDVTQIVLIIDIITMLIVIILSTAYIIPIIFIRRFQTTYNILTGNICLTILIASVFWITFNTLTVYNASAMKQSIIACYITAYFPAYVNCSTVYAVVVVTMNRFFAIVYPNKRFFKTQAWCFISLSIQWTVAILAPLPRLIFPLQTCQYKSLTPYWRYVYNIHIIVLLPSILNAIFNVLIVKNVRSSTRRIHAGIVDTNVSTNAQQNSARDVHLLKHISFIFIISVIGWAPVYLYEAITANPSAIQWLFIMLQILPSSKILKRKTLELHMH
ncbi:unnamed protein product [Adineta steineri]|uniref:G-protein coupled receptors family 1 profile domain-containing protein n=2 Tax=Adineta steineri TaxID=433720 RepID=A0A819K9W3_9BILA|nr:unnamed protein product [Adineta steineri]